MSQVSASKTNNQLTYKKKMRPSERRSLWLGRIFIWIMIVVTMFPIVAIFSASLAKGDTFTQTTFFPAEWGFQNYVTVIKETDFLIWVKNSLIICTSVATIQLLITLPAAFSFSRLRFKGRRNGLMSLLILQMFPAMMSIPAILAIAYKMDGMDNMFVLIILLSAGSAYNIWLLKGFIDGIPKDLDEAAFVDGATTWQMFTRIILPLTKNMLLVIFLFSFIGVYSEFILTSALMKDNSTQTVATGLRTFINNNFSAKWTQYSAAAIMASVPVVIIFVSLQKFISKGLVAGAVKG